MSFILLLRSPFCFADRIITIQTAIVKEIIPGIVMNKLIRVLIALAFSMLAISAIFFFSEQNGSASHQESNQLATKLAEEITSLSTKTSFPNNEKNTVARALNHPLRKCAHLLIYFCLGFILYLSAVFIQAGKRKPVFILVCLLIIIMVACADEINQFFTEGRGSSVKDVLIDTVGGALGIYFYYIITDFIGHVKDLFRKQIG